MSRQRKGCLESVHTRVRKCHHQPECKMRNAAVIEQKSSSLSDVRCPDLGLLLAALLWLLLCSTAAASLDVVFPSRDLQAGKTGRSLRFVI